MANSQPSPQTVDFRYLLKLPSCCILTLFIEGVRYSESKEGIAMEVSVLLIQHDSPSCFIVLVMGYVVGQGRAVESLRQQGFICGFRVSGHAVRCSQRISNR